MRGSWDGPAPLLLGAPGLDAPPPSGTGFCPLPHGQVLPGLAVIIARKEASVSCGKLALMASIFPCLPRGEVRNCRAERTFTQLAGSPFQPRLVPMRTLPRRSESDGEVATSGPEKTGRSPEEHVGRGDRGSYLYRIESDAVASAAVDGVFCLRSADASQRRDPQPTALLVVEVAGGAASVRATHLAAPVFL